MKTDEKRVYTVQEIQDILGIGRNAAYRLVSSGVFKAVRIGSSIRISKASFEEWFDHTDKSDNKKREGGSDGQNEHVGQRNA